MRRWGRPERALHRSARRRQRTRPCRSGASQWRAPQEGREDQHTPESLKKAPAVSCPSLTPLKLVDLSVPNTARTTSGRPMIWKRFERRDMPEHVPRESARIIGLPLVVGPVFGTDRSTNFRCQRRTTHRRRPFSGFPRCVDLSRPSLGALHDATHRCGMVVFFGGGEHCGGVLFQRLPQRASVAGD